MFERSELILHAKKKIKQRELGLLYFKYKDSYVMIH